MTQMQMHKMFHSRRRNPDGTSFTKKLAAERRVQLAAFVLAALPAEDLMAVMTSARPPSIDELIQLAQQHVAEIPCPHCGNPLPKGD
jgi:hypothetical protein